MTDIPTPSGAQEHQLRCPFCKWTWTTKHSPHEWGYCPECRGSYSFNTPQLIPMAAPASGAQADERARLVERLEDRADDIDDALERFGPERLATLAYREEDADLLREAARALSTPAEASEPMVNANGDVVDRERYDALNATIRADRYSDRRAERAEPAGDDVERLARALRLAQEEADNRSLPPFEKCRDEWIALTTRALELAALAAAPQQEGA